MTEKNLDVQMEEAAKKLLAEIVSATKDVTLQEKAAAFKVVTTYYALLRKEPIQLDDDDDREPTIAELAGSLHDNRELRGHGENGIHSRRR